MGVRGCGRAHWPWTGGAASCGPSSTTAAPSRPAAAWLDPACRPTLAGRVPLGVGIKSGEVDGRCEVTGGEGCDEWLSEGMGGLGLGACEEDLEADYDFEAANAAFQRTCRSSLREVGTKVRAAISPSSSSFGL